MTAATKKGRPLQETGPLGIRQTEPDSQQNPRATQPRKDAALALAAAGWRVFPLVEGAKRPITTHGVKDATSDPSEIASWWRRYPGANIGVAVPADMLAVDVDTKGADGHAALAALEAEHGTLPETRTVETPSGGRHLIFRKPSDVRLTNRVNVKPGIDVRTGGGYLVAPPSEIDGRPYRLLIDREPAEAPRWLLDVLTAKPEAPAAPHALQMPAGDPYAVRAIERALAGVLTAPEGTRNAQLNSAAFGLARLAAAGRLDWPQTAAQLERAAASAGLEHVEVRATLRSAYQGGSAEPNFEGAPTAATDDFSEWKTDADGVMTPPVARLKPVSVADVLTHPAPPPRYIWDGYVPRAVVTLLGAHGGVGKSTIALMLAVSVAIGRPLFGTDTDRSAVTFLSLEDGAEIVRHRLGRICKTLQVEPSALHGLNIVDGTTHPELFAADGRGTGSPTSTYVELRSLVRGSGLIVIDNGSDAFAGDEIQRRQVRAFMRSLSVLAAENDAGLLLLAHVDKATGRARKAEGGEGYSGSTAWHNSARSRLFLSRAEGGQLTLEHQKSNFGRLRGPIRLEWPADGLPQLDGAPITVSAQAADTARTQALLTLISEFSARGEHVSAATTSRTNAARLLASEVEFPRNLKPAEVFDLLRRAERDGYLTRATYRGADRKPRECWQVTPTGQVWAGLELAATAATAATPEVTAPPAAECGDCGDSVGGYGGKSAHTKSPQKAPSRRVSKGGTPA